MVETAADGTFSLGVTLSVDPARQASLALRADHPDFAAEVLDLPFEAIEEPVVFELGAGGSLSGRVTASQRPVEGAIVAIGDGFGDVRTTRTDDAGDYRFERLRAGTWQAALGKSEDVTPDDDRMRPTIAEPPIHDVTIIDGQECHLNLVAPGDASAAWIYGRFLVDGEPLTGVTLHLVVKGGPLLGVKATTDKDGRYRVASEHLGAGDLRYLGPLRTDGTRILMIVPLDVTPGEHERTFDLRTGDVAGRVASPNDVKVALRGSLAGGGYYQVLGRDADVELSGVPAGRLDVVRYVEGANASLTKDWEAVASFQVPPGGRATIDVEVEP